MLYVDDTFYEKPYFERCEAMLAAHPLLGDCMGKRVAACVSDTAFSIALVLYLKARGGSLFPLATDTPLEAARRRAERSRSDYLLFGADAETALAGIETFAVVRDEAQRPSLVQMSSGTTGEPKYIERSWASIDEEVASYARTFASADELTPIVACPVNHSYGLISGVLVALHRGVAPVIIKNLNPKYILRKLAEAKKPLLYSSPTLIATITLLASEERPIHAVMTSGTLLSKSFYETAKKKVRHLHQQYGCSEAGCVTLGENISTSNELGVPLPHLTVAAGTYDTPAEIVVARSSGKVIETRDLGYVEGGKLHFVSRLDDMISVSGLNVYPSEIEEVVLELPHVTDAVAFKRGHGFGADQVCLQFVADVPLSNAIVREHCAQRLARHQVPMSITQVAHIEKLPNGKVSRKALAEAENRRDAAKTSTREALS